MAAVDETRIGEAVVVVADEEVQAVATTRDEEALVEVVIEY